MSDDDAGQVRAEERPDVAVPDERTVEWAAGSENAPGAPRAVAKGCLCSVLANAAYRAGADEEPCVDPRCPLHAAPA